MALDLFCGAGGASMGLHRAGFEVVGIDHRPQPRYPFTFIQADALQPPVRLDDFDLIWASPPCQAHVSLSRVGGAKDHPDLIPPTRAMLAGLPGTIIENVWTAPIRRDVALDGGMFNLNTWRKRAFELSFFCLQPPPGPRFGPTTRPGSVSVCGHTGGAYRPRRATARGNWIGNGSIEGWRQAMGIHWMTAREMAQAIPPAYAEFIARAFLAQRQTEHLTRPLDQV